VFALATEVIAKANTETATREIFFNMVSS